MRDPHGRVGGVDGLAARARRALDVDPEVAGLVDLHLDLVHLGQDDDGRSARVDAAAGLRRRDALHAMDAALELEPAVGAVAGDLEDRLLDAADAGLVEAHEVRVEPVLQGIPGVHPQELGREQRRLLAAGAGPDLHDDVAVVVGIARDERDLEILDEPRLPGLELRDLVAGHRLHLLVRLGVEHVAGAGQLLADVAQLPVRGDDRLQAGQLPPQPAQLVGIREHLGRSQLAADLVVLAREARELGVETGVGHGGPGPPVSRRWGDRWRRARWPHPLPLPRRSRRPPAPALRGPQPPSHRAWASARGPGPGHPRGWGRRRP